MPQDLHESGGLFMRESHVSRRADGSEQLGSLTRAQQVWCGGELQPFFRACGVLTGLVDHCEGMG